ncbi:LexA family protein [Bosea sp. (in: a-proteobacteria)]|uniref:LexA family protein n=1 Tax=Bosea sp. (in: a-proteobacteria) TaxID=1871050 RepID=UPI002B463578|nr:S24 family peptidase [Bosea sp. (in: a-proteobacteria)]WRH58468.1 MAG: S24 family peptidase [Bosea sp. (in: a-proteobacteria)]
MKDTGIHDCDVVVVDRSRKPRHGDVVVASINREVSLKLFKNDGRPCMGRDGLQTFYSEVMRVELGRAFCNTHCGIERIVFLRSADRVFGPLSGCS